MVIQEQSSPIEIQDSFRTMDPKLKETVAHRADGQTERMNKEIIKILTKASTEALLNIQYFSIFIGSELFCHDTENEKLEKAEVQNDNTTLPFFNLQWSDTRYVTSALKNLEAKPLEENKLDWRAHSRNFNVNNKAL
ncbi:hypothetical protein ACTFIW_003255 [Dictyostelium discoideum]